MTEAQKHRPACRLLKPAPRPIAKGLSGPRLSAIQLLRSKWANGTVLTYHFLAGVNWEWTELQKDVVREAFATWKSLGIGLDFREVDNPIDATVRIGFLQGDGSWSYVGTDLLHNADPDGRNMNFGWSLTDAGGWATALHETGHAIGFEHEHQNPNSGLVWNEEAVYEYFEKTPNEWSRDQTLYNIIRKLAVSEVVGSNWDPTSIMHYHFEVGLIAAPQHYRDFGIPENTSLSSNDIAWVRRFFPPLAAAVEVKAGDTVQIASASGAQTNFALMADKSGEFMLKTSGPADTLIVLNEEKDGQLMQVAASDDSGSPQNAEIRIALQPGRRYLAQVRTNYADPGSAVAFTFA